MAGHEGFTRAINRIDPGHTGLGQPDGMIFVSQQTFDAFTAAGYDPDLFTVTEVPDGQIWATHATENKIKVTFDTEEEPSLMKLAAIEALRYRTELQAAASVNRPIIGTAL